MHICFGDEKRTIESATALEPVLAEAAKHQTLLFLVGDSGTLAVGVGHPTHAVLLYNSTAERPPVHALGDSTADSCELQPPLTFDGRGFSDRCAISARRARDVARAFVESNGVLPNAIIWEPEPVVSTTGT